MKEKELSVAEKTRKTKRWQWYGNRDTIRHMNNEF